MLWVILKNTKGLAHSKTIGPFLESPSNLPGPTSIYESYDSPKMTTWEATWCLFLGYIFALFNIEKCWVISLVINYLRNLLVALSLVFEE